MNHNKALRIFTLFLLLFLGIQKSHSLTLPSIEFDSIFGLGDGDGGGQAVGNGGDLVVCYMGDGTSQVKLAELSDFFEGREIYQHVHINKQDDNFWKLKWPHIVKIVLDDLGVHDPMRADFYKDQIPPFVDADNSLSGRNQDVSFLSGLELPDVPDSGGVILPAGCVLKQGAIFKTREFPDEPIFLINRDYWKHLSEMSKAGLVLHEIIFKEAKTFAAINSRAVRNFNSYLFTLSLGKRDFSNYLKRLGLTTIKEMGFSREKLLTDILGLFKLNFSVSTFPTQAGDAFLELNLFEENEDFIVATQQNLDLRKPLNNRIRTHFDSSFSFPDGQKHIRIQGFHINKRQSEYENSRAFLKTGHKEYEPFVLVRNRDKLTLQIRSGLLSFDSRGELTSEMGMPCTENDLKFLEASSLARDSSYYGHSDEFAKVDFGYETTKDGGAGEMIDFDRSVRCGDHADSLSILFLRSEKKFAPGPSRIVLQNGISRDVDPRTGRLRKENFILHVHGLEKLKWKIFGQTWLLDSKDRYQPGVSLVIDLKKRQLYFADPEKASKNYVLTSK
jgi:hypothetical protein